MIQSGKKLDRVVSELKAKNMPGLSLFLTGGYPTMSKFLKIVKFIDKENLADFLEIGIPFSDPVADGPIIQESSRQAIEKGATFRNIIEAVDSIKDQINIPLILMSYLNPVYAGGLRKNLKLAVDAGFSAAIIPDLPIDESGEIFSVLKGIDMDLVFLAAPSTSFDRIKVISCKSFPFLYYVSRFGTTGERKDFSKGIIGKIKDVKKYSKVPVYCGFGISNSKQASVIGKYADGVIIGSALIHIISRNKSSYLEQIRKFAISIRNELKSCRSNKVNK